MKAALIRTYGGPEVLEIADVPAPKPGAGEVVVEVKATSVNPVDWLVRDGGAKSFVKVKFPVILGCDLAGTVAELGRGVTQLRVGDEVFAMMPHDWGAHAERVVLAEGLVVKKPPSLTMIEAASLPVVAVTALNGVKKRGGLVAGERILVNGASGGVGLCAVQIAKDIGAHVTAVCGAASEDLVKQFGADVVVDYKKTDFTKGDAKYDMIFDCAGTKPYGDCARVLQGRKVHVTVQPRPSTFIRMFLNPLFGTKVYAIITTGNGADLTAIAALVEKGALKPNVDRVFPFAEVASAQEYSKAGKAKGKLVLEL